MPWKGDLHFYYHKQYRNIIPFFGVNALNGATSISTALKNLYAVGFECVNALNGATSISTEEEIETIPETLVCQCPERGDLHFYLASKR